MSTDAARAPASVVAHAKRVVSTERLSLRRRRWHAGAFIAAALASGWLGVLLNHVLSEPQDLNSPGAGLWLVIPLATTVAVRFAGTGWRQGGWAPRWGVAVPWYAVGAVWALWHLPYYLVFVDETTLRSTIDLPRPAATAALCATMLGWSVLFTELYRLSRSIWPCVLMHAVQNALVDPLVLGGHIRLSAAGSWVVSPIAGVVTTAAYVCLGLGLRARRRRAGP